MEVAIGGTGKRATINSYMYADAVAIAKIASLAGKTEIAQQFREKAERIKTLVQTKLWDPQAQFFKVLPRDKDSLVDVRELHGYTPWYANLPDDGLRAGLEADHGPAGLLRPLRPHNRRAEASGISTLLRGTRVPVERAELAVRDEPSR